MRLLGRKDVSLMSVGSKLQLFFDEFTLREDLALACVADRCQTLSLAQLALLEC